MKNLFYAKMCLKCAEIFKTKCRFELSMKGMSFGSTMRRHCVIQLNFFWRDVSNTNVEDLLEKMKVNRKLPKLLQPLRTQRSKRDVCFQKKPYISEVSSVYVNIETVYEMKGKTIDGINVPTIKGPHNKGKEY